VNAVRPALLFLLLLAAPHAAAQGFLRAEAPRAWDLPRDHRAHPEMALEWWYLTGHLDRAGGARLGYQATFFRKALVPPLSVPARPSPFAASQVILWHGAVTDLEQRSFVADEVLARDAAGWAQASDESLDVAVLGRSLRQVAPDRWELRAMAAGWTLELDYVLDRPPVLHGSPPGLSVKGPEPGQATHYVSRVHLRTLGFVTPPGGSREAVTGLSWFDQEIGSGQLAPQQVGWDWFSVNLDDGSALMVYMLRERDGSTSPQSSGTFVTADGRAEHLRLDELRVTATSSWTSPRTGGRYPAAWRLQVPRLGLDLEVTASVADQERGGAGSAGPAYWEGSCRFEGTRDGRRARGDGYVELVGYAGAIILR
jgi:predicted secreted hydrolase